MRNEKTIKRKLMFFFANVVICSAFFISYLNKILLPVFLEYGEYQCGNILTKIINVSVEENVTEQLKTKMVVQNKENNSLDFNVDVLNSLMYNVLNRSQQIFSCLEKGVLDKEILKKIDVNVSEEKIKRGIVYEVPISMAFNNALIGNLGINIPVKYKLIGEVRGQIISSVKEYGINNALLEISLKIVANTKVLVPMKSIDKKSETSVPMFVTIIQGEIPDYYLGTNVIGGGK